MSSCSFFVSVSPSPKLITRIWEEKEGEDEDGEEKEEKEEEEDDDEEEEKPEDEIGDEDDEEEEGEEGEKMKEMMVKARTVNWTRCLWARSKILLNGYGQTHIWSGLNVLTCQGSLFVVLWLLCSFDFRSWQVIPFGIRYMLARTWDCPWLGICLVCGTGWSSSSSGHYAKSGFSYRGIIEHGWQLFIICSFFFIS